MPLTLADPQTVAVSPRGRAEDLMAAFADPDVAGIVSTIGGDDSIRLLPFLDLDVISANPKIFLGYSDTTVSHMACQAAGLVSYYGPSILAGFAENTGLPAYAERGLRATLFDPQPALPWPENHDGWMVEELDWGDPANQSRPRRRNRSTGWRWLQGEGTAEGPLVVGCLEVLDWLRGTRWWPQLDGRVLAIETSEEAPPPQAVTYFLRSLAAAGDLQRLAALLVGRPGGADLPVEAHKRYDEAVLAVVQDEQQLDLTVVAGMDFGHTDPMWTLPIGLPVRIDVDERSVTFPEPATT
jgi:muramoyltetrapeptide carboxypeptidase LdcA involved in peptidoglycan recycling